MSPLYRLARYRSVIYGRNNCEGVCLIVSMPRSLRSQQWFSGKEYYNFARRAWLRSEGFTADVFENRPVIGICNSWSELNNCNAHLRGVAEAVKRGVWRAGGFPLEFP